MVFKTIVENVKSFVAREEELMHAPKKVPDAASEVLGSQKLVAQKPLPQNTSPSYSQDSSAKSQLAFSAKDLLAARQEQRQEPSPAPVQNTRPVQESHFDEGGALDHEVRAFEEAMNSLQPAQSTPEPLSRQQTAPEPARAPMTVTPSVMKTSSPLQSQHSSPGFFSSFEEFLNEDGIDEKHFDGDLLHKMREFHERQKIGKEPLSHKNSAANAVERRLYELQSLENEWQHLFTQSHDIERSMIHLEEEIQEKTSALKSLLEESKKLSFLAKEVSQEHAFILANGTKVTSLGSLLHALQKEPWLYDAHVRDGRNDFASWVEGAFANSSLANSLRSVSSLADCMKTLRGRQ